MGMVKSLGWSCGLTAAALERVDFELMEWWSTCGCVSVIPFTNCDTLVVRTNVFNFLVYQYYSKVYLKFFMHLLGLPAS